MQSSTAAAVAHEAPAAPHGVAAILRRLRRNHLAMAGLLIVGFFIFLSIAAPVVAPRDPYEQVRSDRNQAPSAQYWFGTDDLGRDNFSRIVYGSRISVYVGVVSVGIALVVGGLLGTLSGYFGGVTDLLVMRVIDVMMAFPAILLAIAITAVLGPGLLNTMIAVGIVQIPGYARLVRSTVLSLVEEDFIEAARALGSTHVRIMWRHVLPNCLAPVVVQATLGVSGAILSAATLSFLGLGARPPEPEWGLMLSQSRTLMLVAPWNMIFPGLAIMVLVLGLNLLGDGLRDALDPQMKDR